MRINDDVKQTVRAYDEKWGINYVKPDGKFYKVIMAIYVLALIFTTAINVFFALGVSMSETLISKMKTPLYISEHKRISEILMVMQKSKMHMAIVVDQYGGTEGIVTLEDIIEELVGEIYDESDEEDTSFVRISDKRLEVSPDLSVSDFLERLGLPDETIETERTSMGGWIMDILDRIPEQNRRAEWTITFFYL